MKDENGAVQIGANITVETAARESMKMDIARYVKDKLSDQVGEEVTSNFEPIIDHPVWLAADVYHLQLVVLTKYDYEKLADSAWKYNNLGDS